MKIREVMGLHSTRFLNNLLHMNRYIVFNMINTVRCSYCSKIYHMKFSGNEQFFWFEWRNFLFSFFSPIIWCPKTLKISSWYERNIFLLLLLVNVFYTSSSKLIKMGGKIKSISTVWRKIKRKIARIPRKSNK